jgi:hypothetical protein
MVNVKGMHILKYLYGAGIEILQDKTVKIRAFWDIEP